MKDQHPPRTFGHFNRQDTFFRLINPDEYANFGIDPLDVPMGTFAAEDHPSFLPSRLGGNAYGLGLIEQSALSKADTDFLQSLDYQDIIELGHHSKRLNSIYQKLGLLIRYSPMGKRYFLIPINLVAHSLQDVKTKADEIEELIRQHIMETGTERLDIGLLTTSQDLTVHELTARLSIHRIFIFDSLDKIRSWRLPLDIVILPKDIFEYLLEQQLPQVSRKTLSRRKLQQYAVYLAGKIHDLLEPSGKLIVLANSPAPSTDETCTVRFKLQDELKSFLLFAHIYKTKGKYTAKRGLQMQVHISDLYYYLNRFTYSEPHLKKLLNNRKLENLSLREINQLAHLNIRLPQPYIKDPEKRWKSVFEAYFDVHYRTRDSARADRQYWHDRMEIDCSLPEGLLILVAQPRQPSVSLESLEEDLKASGMQGCSLQLVAEYRNTFHYVRDVLNVLTQIRNHDFPKLSELELSRLSNPFRTRGPSFSAVLQLLGQMSKIERACNTLNPDHIEGQSTPVLENIHKLSLQGFSKDQLREILLIVVGHTSMSRIVFGKLPAKSLKPITDRAREENYQDILSLLRVCRLMSMAEIAAAFGEAFTRNQAKELYRLYDDAIQVAMDARLDWERLTDLQISRLGGVQNKAIREMLKFFNLFEFLDNWQEFVNKGPFQKEVICDYQPEKLADLEEVLQLSRTANQFKQQFLGDYIFGKSYFFRQFLNTEFHGTGHLFPKLGTRAGFVLLWIAVNSSEKHIVNFNPLLAGISQDRHEQRITKIKDSLLRIPIERLEPKFFEEIKETLALGRPAFVFDSGIRMMNNAVTRAMDVSFVDVDENIRQIEVLLKHLESQELRGISLRSLQDMERLFSELESFHEYLDREGCTLQCDVFEQQGGKEAKSNEIKRIEQKLKLMLQKQIFVPEEIHDTISTLAKHCPEILRFILPEFHAFGNLIENWPTRHKQLLGTYVMRCLEKFQALIIKDRNAFQDRNTFYQLAKKELGPLAEEGIGATHAQMETLEYLVDRVQQQPSLYQALTLALLFQEIGKIEKYWEEVPDAAHLWTHAKAGALILEKTEILKNYQVSPQVARLVILLVRYHGLIGHVLQGEEPIIGLQQITAEHDDRLLDVFVLHAIIAAASVQEGLMVSDLLDAFLSFRAVALEIVKSKSDWSSWLKDLLRETGRAALAEPDVEAGALGIFPGGKQHFCEFSDEDIEDEALWRGRQICALERLFKLMGARWIDYHDIQMHFLKMPINFIYHKKKLKSVGRATFEKQLTVALKILEEVSSLNSELRYYLLYCLDHLGAAMRIYDFHPLCSFLDPGECIKLLLIAFRAFHYHYGEGATGGIINFRPLSQQIEQRYGALQSILRETRPPAACVDGQEPHVFDRQYGGLHFLRGSLEKGIQVKYQDAVQIDAMIRSLESFWNHDELSKSYREMMAELSQKVPYDTRDYQQKLEAAYTRQCLKINDRVLKEFQERLKAAEYFADFEEIDADIRRQQAHLLLTDEQQSLLEEMLEYHRSRIRERYLDSVFRKINGFETRTDLIDYWNRLKFELFSYRSHIGKEYESMIAELIDQKLEKMDAARGS